MLCDSSECIPDTQFHSSCHQEPILTRICKKLRRERSEDLDPDHPILSGWYVFLSKKTIRSLTKEFIGLMLAQVGH